SETYWQCSYDTSLLMAIHAHTLALEIDNKQLIAKSLNMTGNAYYLMGDFTKSMDHYLKALVIREELGDSNSIASSYNNIGAVYLQMKDHQRALYYLKKAKIIFEALQDEVHLFSIMNNIGAVYIENEKYDTAYQYLTEAYEIAQRTRDEDNTSIALTNLGETALSMGLLSQSLDYQKKALAISRKLGNKAMMATIYTNLGKTYLETKNYQQAYDAFHESLDLSEEVNSLPDLRENYRYLSEYYDIQRDYKQALNYYRLYASTKDSINSQEAMIRIKEMENISQAQAMQQEIELLRKDNEISNLEATRLKNTILFLAAVSLMIILVFVVYYQKNRLKRETTRLLEEKNKQLEKSNLKLQNSEKHLKELNSTKDKFFSIIGHDLRNPLNALLGFSELISGNSRDHTSEEIQRYSKIINEAAKNIHLLIENLLEWSRSQSGNIDYNPEKTDLMPMVTEIFKVFEIHADKKGVSMVSDIPEDVSIYADRNLLSTILRNLISNAVKYTLNGGQVRVFCEQNTSEITISVEDTGIGMSEKQLDNLFRLDSNVTMPGTSEEKGTGLGLILCREFVDMHQGKIWASSKPKEGSIFSFTLPLKVKQ
ncbi:MAG: tetratricopeptide repeat-containing sensor histidine kinase, partial [Bacteroidales bacterium]|nr:tetratricopeptide repeat-containing sensor histidine kinase [Bacteroidales bacterium]